MLTRKRCPFLAGMVALFFVSLNSLGADDAPLLPRPASDTEGLHALLSLLHCKSRRATMTLEEETLLYKNGFSPEVIPRLFLSSDAHPAWDEIAFQKKSQYMPFFRNGKLHESGGKDAVVARWNTEGYTIQVVQEKTSATFFAMAKHSAWDNSPLWAERPEPRAFADVFDIRMFSEAEVREHAQGRLSDGRLVHCVRLASVAAKEPPTLDAHQFRLIWAHGLLVLAVSMEDRSLKQIATPSRHDFDLFVREGLDPYSDVRGRLRELSSKGPAACEDIALHVVRLLKEIPPAEEDWRRQNAQHPVEWRTRRKTIREGLRLMTSLLANMEELPMMNRRMAWQAAARAVPDHAIFKQEAKEMARALLASVQQFGEPSDLQSLSDVFMGRSADASHPYFGLKHLANEEDMIDEALSALLKNMAEEDAQRYTIREIDQRSEQPDESPGTLLFLLKSMAHEVDPPGVKLPVRILKRTEMLKLRLAAIHQLGKWFAAQKDGSSKANACVLENLDDDAAQVRSECAWVLGRTGRLKDVEYLAPLLRDPSASVREQAAESLCMLCGWDWQYLSDSRSHTAAIANLKEQVAPVLEALNVMDDALRQGDDPN